MHGKKIMGISPEAMSCLKKYQWPGNIRELENVMEYAFVIESGNSITMGSLPEKVLNSIGVDLNSHKPHSNDEVVDTVQQVKDENVAAGMLTNIKASELDFNKQKEAFEKEFIIKALKSFNGRINQTALHANIPKKTLLRKIEKYGINPKEYTE
jgi:DNA-binding NtrC family response regulator